MRVVLDTNVLVSALLTPGGTCDDVLRLLSDGVIDICIDERVLREYGRVLPRPRLRLDREDGEGTLGVIRAQGTFLMPAALSVQLPDPSDLAFLEVAAQAGALLVTGNARHFPRDARAGVTVVTPRELLELVRSEG